MVRTSTIHSRCCLPACQSTPPIEESTANKQAQAGAESEPHQEVEPELLG